MTRPRAGFVTCRQLRQFPWIDSKLLHPGNKRRAFDPHPGSRAIGSSHTTVGLPEHTENFVVLTRLARDRWGNARTRPPKSGASHFRCGAGGRVDASLVKVLRLGIIPCPFPIASWFQASAGKGL